MAVLVVVVATAALVFGTWATVAGKSGVFGSLTGVIGVCLLVLVVLLAAVGILAWAQHPLGDQQPLGTRVPSADMVMVPVPRSGGSGPDTLTIPVVVGDLLPEPQQSEPPPDPMAELEAVWAADPGSLCAGVLELMSVLSAAGIRRDLVYAAGQAGLLGGGTGAGADVDAVAGALGQLAERSLLSFSVDGRVVSAGRPVLLAVRDRLAGQDRLVAACRAAASVLEARCEALASSPNRLAALDVPDQV